VLMGVFTRLTCSLIIFVIHSLNLVNVTDQILGIIIHDHVCIIKKVRYFVCDSATFIEKRQIFIDYLLFFVNKTK